MNGHEKDWRTRWPALLREALRLWMPPAVASALRRIRKPPAAPPPFTWSGVYERFADVPAVGKGYQDEALAGESAAATVAAMNALSNPGASRAPGPAPRDGGLLTLLVAEVARRRQPVEVVDFGGAVGIDYVFVRALTRHSPVRLRYCVVEHPVTCELGRRVHSDDASIRFVQAIDSGMTPAIVHASASLAYVNEWRGKLKDLLALDPEYFLLANTFVGDFPTFASAQLNLRQTVAMWFFGRAEVAELFESAGYRLALEVRTGREYDQSNLPPNRRSGRACNLLFRKESGGGGGTP